MTRRLVYSSGLFLTIACTAMTIASIVLPRWVSYSPKDKRELSYGLHTHCSSITGICKPFPQFEDCARDKWSFCSMWRTVGFLISFAVVVELCTLVTFFVIISGGVQRRSTGWTIPCSLLLFASIIQCAGMAIVSFLFDHDERFFDGWYLDNSWVLCTVSWSVLFLTSAGITASALYLPEEGGYELIPDRCYDLEVEEDMYEEEPQ
ncbi:uncharacterized protein BDR25DRAFT_84885 [Lindgomyces ingoldianus]|uniref:Uncharacterized protein n=1 Tax=Lindgomyces ingoldianus TaxID=673940 RepID=A0ACB6QF73_9PLEO|nr:uncharacterized protein BDR25DRAFT_84885 [Lindgomyces ingoldianus]KAF2465542.1 hypothetical protein BDR25DRAFT_84885 [Lindgomyces ingoldianus]